MDINLKGNAIRLVNTSSYELSNIIQFETISGFIGKNTLEEHQNLLNDPNCLHLTIKHLDTEKPIGHIILSGVHSKNKSLEFRRILISEPGKGYGRDAIALIKQICFEQLNLNRLWLDVHTDNHKAIGLYESENFIKEGTLKSAVRTPDGYKSVHIYAILKREYDSTNNN